MKKHLITLLLLTVSAFSFASNGGFHDDFEARRQLLPAYCLDIFSTNLSTEQREALEFLYAYMPLPDIANHDGEFFLQNVDASLKARQEMKWGRKVPQREWLHFVLPVRVNNEDMDLSRLVFYEELRQRVKGMSMRDAALEVNHWCHEKVTYTPSDGRTSAPLATVRNALGRCGEESTFCVAAMRSVGIPARQVYTPRWAHTDDNHAWVEVWIDGKWHFLGACEPEAVLDLGWFNAPASRGMLMHTKAFGRYDGPEEVMSSTNCYTEINVTANYAPVAMAKVRVVDTEGNPVQGAKVEYKLYNYAEFYTVATKTSDADGMCQTTCGKGDMLIWASKDGHFGLTKIRVGWEDMVTVSLDKDKNYVGAADINITPPAERNTIPRQTPRQIARNKARFAHEDSIRTAYTSTFMRQEQCPSLAEAMRLPAERVARVLTGARGNHRIIFSFLQHNPTMKALMLLESLSAKDLHDVTAETLADHYTNTPAETPDIMTSHYIYSPRISNELLTPWRAFLCSQSELQDLICEAQTEPETVVQWVKDNIKTDNQWNPQAICMAPENVYRMRTTDSHSRDIFFVALARTCGIASRIDEVTGKTQYKTAESDWIDVDWTGKTDSSMAPKGLLKATFEQEGYIDDPKYYSHFSLSKIENGQLQLLSYPEEGITWNSLLRQGERLDGGQYLLVTGTRLAGGGVLAHIECFPVYGTAETEVALKLRQSNEDMQVIGSFNSENIYNDDQQGAKSLLSTTGRGYYVLGIIAPNQEPTNHTLRDISLLAKDFEAWGQSIVLLFKDKEEQSRFTNRNEFPNLPGTVVWGTDLDGRIWNELKQQMKLTSEQLPVFVIADTFNRVVFISQGYTIGLGEQMINAIHKISRKNTQK